MEDSKSRKTPSMVPPIIPEYHAAMTFPEMMPDAVDLDNEIQGMLSWVPMNGASEEVVRVLLNNVKILLEIFHKLVP